MQPYQAIVQDGCGIPSVSFCLWHKWQRLVHFLWTLPVICTCHLEWFWLWHVRESLRRCLLHLVLYIFSLCCFLLNFSLGAFTNAHSYSEHSMWICIKHVCASQYVKRLNTENIFRFSLPLAPALRIFGLPPPWAWAF